MLRQCLLVLLLTGVLTGCATLSTPDERRTHADQLAATHGWHAERFHAGMFDLVAYRPDSFANDEVLTVYIEGDGFAWVNASTPSEDPTPRDPLALRLALLHPGGNAAYLGRPCQYVGAAQNGCAQRFWTGSRFAPEVIEATNSAIDALKRKANARQLLLIGYSGGAAVAALLAARRDDVSRLVTVAGNLDHRAWTAHHRVEPLSGSLNPADTATKLVGLPQTHFVGTRDQVIPLELADKWSQAFLGSHSANLHVIPDYNHTCCWVENWSGIFRKIGSH